jgi:tetratricopeptide (TPR) repeat protein
MKISVDLLERRVDIMKLFDISNILSICVLIIITFVGCAEMEPGSYYNRALIYDKKGQYDQAIADYNKAIEINPGDAMAYHNRALIYDKKGQYDQAIADYNKTIKINPRFILAYKNRGAVMMKLGNRKMACSDWKQACELGDCKSYENAKRNGWCK